MFTQRLSMDCTQEQYEKYLKVELEKMGYREAIMTEWRGCSGIVNNLRGNNGAISNVLSADYTQRCRTYLGKFNAPLFLALAAMTDKEEGGYSEYWVWEVRYFTDRWEIMKAITHNKEAFMKSHPKTATLSTETLRKATVNDIMAHFCVPYYREKATVSEIMAKFGEQPTKRGTIEFEVTFNAKSFKESVEKAYKFLEINDAEIDKISKRLDELGEQHTDLLNKVEHLQKRVDGDSEPQYKQPVYGEFAIFWGDKKEKAIISRFMGLDSDGYNFFINKNGYRFSLDNAILFESIEQYNEFIKS